MAVPLVGIPGTVNDSALVNAFLGRLKIQPIRNSRLVKVNFESQDPQLAAKVVNTLAQAYIDWGLSLRLKTQQNAAVFLDEQVKEVKRKAGGLGTGPSTIPGKVWGGGLNRRRAALRKPEGQALRISAARKWPRLMPNYRKSPINGLRRRSITNRPGNSCSIRKRRNPFRKPSTIR